MDIKSNHIQFQNTFTQNVESKTNGKLNFTLPAEVVPKDSIQLSKNTNKSENNTTYTQYSSQNSVPTDASKITNDTATAPIKGGLIRTDDGKMLLKGTNGDNIGISQLENNDENDKEKKYEIHYNKEKHTLTEKETDGLNIELGTGNTFTIDIKMRLEFRVKIQGDNNTINGIADSKIEMIGNNNSVGMRLGWNEITAIGDNNNIHSEVRYYAPNEIKVNGSNNRIYSGDGNDKITVEGNNNRIHGDSGGSSNRIPGNYGNDNITVKGNNNRIHGDFGNDNIELRGSNNKIYGGKGNDIILVTSGNKNRIHGGDGNDIIKAEGDKTAIIGGRGNDYIEGGKGDKFIYGGLSGDNVIYYTGGYQVDGKNQIYGGKGNNYIDAGEGNGIVSGGTGKNIISSKNRNIQIDNVGENDVLIGEWKLSGNTELPTSVKQYTKNSSSDYEIDNFLKNNVIFSTTNDKGNVRNFDEHEGLDFKRRVMSDLETLKYIPEGRKLLEEIAKTKYPLFFAQNAYDYKNCSASVITNSDEPYSFNRVNPNLDGTPNKGNPSLIKYNTSYSLADKSLSESDAPPLVVLGHEMTHSYNQMTGTMIDSSENIAKFDGTYQTNHIKYIPLTEHQAVGIPITGTRQQQPITYPDGTKSLNNPEGLSENALRNSLGLEPRNHYYNPKYFTP